MTDPWLQFAHKYHPGVQAGKLAKIWSVRQAILQTIDRMVLGQIQFEAHVY